MEEVLFNKMELLNYLAVKEEGTMIFYHELEEMFPKIKNSSVVIDEFEKGGCFSYYKQYNGGFGYTIHEKFKKRI
ncbi:TPA: hypothetical protein JRX02_002930 [Elizabethkingia anophelis]|nr:hypothetical protein [Elizabethkingia anophelis]HAY3520398.1 hypothetical protein [Elizabethkingia anophelis]HAY3524118.1 hypothetical protein [Elizabethkingia anophelis]HAY3532071.1 hypothetical protein [Elizabethkingia anophelis]